jgi:gliding motility-associated-like protein
MKVIILYLLSAILYISTQAQCGGNISYTLSVPPSANNTYAPGTVVELCITMDGWNGNSQGSNWFEGFYIALGGGWQTVTPTLFPQDAEAASGDWIWTTLTTNPTGATAGPGFFFEGPAGPTDGNPGNDWGDSCPSTTCVWSCCVELVAASGPPGLDLHIGVIPYADGTMGSWGTQACNDIQTNLFDGSIGCLTPGCTDADACNYDPTADCDDNSCTYSGCNDPLACNYDATAGCDDGSCTYSGCTDPLACNFDATAGCDDGSCNYTPDIIFNPTSYNICLNSSVQLNAEPAGGYWTHEFDTTRTYTIKVIAYDTLGCESEPKLISVTTKSCQRFFAPNSFTPNGDGINDVFEIRGLSVYKPTMKIFNRWGVEVYVSSNLWWTGDSGSGYYCDNGIYNWIVEYRDKFGQNRQESGHVILIR